MLAILYTTYKVVIVMPMSEAKRKANEKWNNANLKEKYDRIQLVVQKGKKEKIQAGESVNGFIWRLIQAELDRLHIQP